MPIRINLLAEAQELDESRRKDPVKRVILWGVVCLALMLGWSATLFGKSMMAKSEANRIEVSISALSNDYRQILDNQKTLGEDKRKLDALRRLANERFLVGNLLNALQQTTLDSVQLVELKLDQDYQLVEEVKPKAEEKIVAKPAMAKEKIELSLSAKDRSAIPGDGVGKFQEVLSKEPFFEKLLGKTNGFRLASMGATEKDPDGRPFLLMKLEGRVPEKTRQ